MNFLNSMLSAATWSWEAVIDEANKNGANWTWVKTLLTTMSTVLWVLLALVGAAGGIYALYVGIKMARADSAEQREENKKRLINIVVSIVVVIVLILFFNTFLPAILGAFGVFEFDAGKSKKPETLEGGTTPTSIQTLVNTARVLLRR